MDEKWRNYVSSDTTDNFEYDCFRIAVAEIMDFTYSSKDEDSVHGKIYDVYYPADDNCKLPPLDQGVGEIRDAKTEQTMTSQECWGWEHKASQMK